MSVNNQNRAILAQYLLGQGSSATQGKNYVRNSFAMNGTANVSVSGTATVAKNTTTPLTGISDFLITLPNNTTDYVEFALDTLDNALTNQNCQLTLDYKIGSIGSVVQAQVLIGGVVSNSQTINASPTQSSLSLNVPCGDLSGATTVRIANAAGNTGTSSINVANVNYGKATNIGTVAQAILVDAVTVTGCANEWTTTSSTYASAGTQTGCVYTSAKGVATAPATNLPAFKFASLPAGDYRIEYEGRYGVSVSGVASAQFTDGTNTARENSVADLNVSGGFSGISQTISYSSPQSNVTLELKLKTTANTVFVSGKTVYPGVFKLWYFPSSSQQAVSSNAISQPTVQRFLSGSGTYTRPAGVTSIKVTMAGGGGNGQAGSVTYGGGGAGAYHEFLVNNPASTYSYSVGAQGANTTFGTNTAGAGSNGSGITGGAGGTVTASLGQTILSISGGAGNNGTGSGTGGGGTNPFSGGAPASGGAGGINAIANSGGGGSGNGGIGAAGRIIVEEFYGMNAPILIGSVTSNSTSALRIEAGRINCGTSSSITNLYGNSWMTTPSNISSGICTSTLSTGWSAAPSCVVTAANTGTVNDLTWKANATSATSLTLLCVAGGAACTGGGDINITCMGSR